MDVTRKAEEVKSKGEEVEVEVSSQARNVLVRTACVHSECHSPIDPAVQQAAIGLRGRVGFDSLACKLDDLILEASFLNDRR